MRVRSRMVAVALVALVTMGSVAVAAESAAEATPGAEPAVGKTVGLAFAAAFVTGLSILGAGIAVGRVGSAAVGAIAEKPELFVRSLVFVALAEGLAVLGFAFGIMVLSK